MVRFVTVSTHRSGSSVFQRWLDSHPKVEARQEDLRMSDLKGENVKKDKLHEFLDSLYSPQDGISARGFKCQYSHVTDPLIDYLRVNDVKVIHLVREDLLETAMWYPGCYSGDTTGGFGEPLELAPDRKVEAIIPKVLANMEWIGNEMAFWEENADMTVTYEEMTEGEDSETFRDEIKAREVLEFLGVPWKNMKLPMRKAKRRDLSHCVSNYYDLIKATNEGTEGQ